MGNIVLEGYRSIRVPMAPDDVLATFVEWHRHQAHNDPEADAGAMLTLETTVAEWRLACDLPAWRELGRRLNEALQIDVSDEEWRAALTPPRQRRLRDVSILIARHARREVIEPLSILGRDCEAAGAFATVRAILREAGADVSDLTPSSDLTPFLRSHAHVFTDRIAPLAPGMLPPLHAPAHPLCVALAWLLAVAWLGMLASWALSLGVEFLCGAMVPVAWLGLVIVSRLVPVTVRFPGLRTFRDLALTLVRQRTGAFPVEPRPQS